MRMNRATPDGSTAGKTAGRVARLRRMTRPQMRMLHPGDPFPVLSVKLPGAGYLASPPQRDTR